MSGRCAAAGRQRLLKCLFGGGHIAGFPQHRAKRLPCVDRLWSVANGCAQGGLCALLAAAPELQQAARDVCLRRARVDLQRLFQMLCGRRRVVQPLLRARQDHERTHVARLARKHPLREAPGLIKAGHLDHAQGDPQIRIGISVVELGYAREGALRIFDLAEPFKGHSELVMHVRCVRLLVQRIAILERCLPELVVRCVAVAAVDERSRPGNRIATTTGGQEHRERSNHQMRARHCVHGSH